MVRFWATVEVEAADEATAVSNIKTGTGASNFVVRKIERRVS
jgi:hypothetical protein